MHQSNAPRRLAEIFTQAVEHGDNSKTAASVLLKYMDLQAQPKNVMFFNHLLSQSLVEAKSIRNIPNISFYVQALEELNQIFTVNHIWKDKWEIFSSFIKSKNILLTLDSIANYLYQENPNYLLDKDFLSQLNNRFELLLEEVIGSDLSNDLKRFLVGHLEAIKSAIRRYQIDGTQGLQNATTAFIADLLKKESSFKPEDKKHSKYNGAKAWILSLLLYLTPTPYDVIGVGPALNDFWIPKFEELAWGEHQVEHMLEETSSLQEVFEKTSHVFAKKSTKSIEGSIQPRALLPGSKAPEIEEGTDDLDEEDESDNQEPDELDENFSEESFKRSWQQAIAGDIVPLSQLWEDTEVV